jgi:TRAP-type C4-dicarboxylate transport system permease small subunit
LKFKSLLDNTTSFFSKVFAFGAGFSMFAVFIIIFINSIRRYTIGKSFEWGEELPVYLAIYGIMFGISWAYMNDKHIRFTILVDFISKKIVHKLYILVDLITISTGIILCYAGYLFALKRGSIESSGLVNSSYDIADNTGIEWFLIIGEMYPYQMAICLGGAMLTIAAILRLGNRLNESVDNKCEEIK